MSTRHMGLGGGGFKNINPDFWLSPQSEIYPFSLFLKAYDEGPPPPQSHPMMAELEDAAYTIVPLKK